MNPSTLITDHLDTWTSAIKAKSTAGIAARQTAAEYLKELEGIGILRSHKVGRENLYLNVSLYEYLAS